MTRYGMLLSTLLAAGIAGGWDRRRQASPAAGIAGG